MYTLTQDSSTVLYSGRGDGLKVVVDALPPDPFAVTTEGNVHFSGGAFASHDGFIHNGTQAEIDAYVAAHYKHV